MSVTIDVAELQEVTSILAGDLHDWRTRVRKHPNTQPIGSRLTASQRKLLRELDGTRLPLVSTALVYGSQSMRSMSAAKQRMLLGLMLGGHLRAYKLAQPLPARLREKSVALDNQQHYLLRINPELKNMS